MRTMIIVLAALLVGGCAGQTKYIVKPQVVEVKLPVPYCPSIETVAPMDPIELETLKLTEADKKDPGKVARAYQIDMIALTQRQSELNRIEQARSASAKETEAQLEEYRRQVQQVHADNMKKVTDETLAAQKRLNDGK